VLNAEPAGAVVDQAHHIDADLIEPDAVGVEPLHREPAEPGPLGPADGFERAAVPQAVLALTSTTTRVYRSTATMSISPAAQRQLRSRIRRPHDFRYSAAACSPDLPSMSLACIAITSGSDDRGNRERPQGANSSCGKPGRSFALVETRARNVSAR
jgi:hypothetical protein